MKTLAATVLLVAGSCAASRNLAFPEGFLFGAASAAYQVEGAWNTSGKGESIWDRLVHTSPSCIAQGATGDVACDSYHKYQEDVKALRTIGFNFYRFSISWPRILPKGDVSVINQDGIDYYNNLINALLANNIQPVVTMYHWDLPEHIQDLGGMANSIVVDYFEDYARLLYTHFGDRVKWWITFNEPLSFVRGYHTECFAPGVVAPGVGEYLVAHNVLKAHARAYRLYDRHFRAAQRGKVSITLNINYAKPKTNSTADIEAAERYLQFNLGWFAHPIYSQEGDYPAVMKERVANNSKAEGLHVDSNMQGVSKLGWFAHPIYSQEGDYPAVMKERVANNSKAEGLPRSRLPEFGEYWVNYIRGTHDFFGLNLYTSDLVSAPSSNVSSSGISMDNDMGNLVVEKDPSWPHGSIVRFRYTPFAMRKMLNWISLNYNQVPILVTENGWCDTGELNDTMRTRYYVNYLASALDAVYQDNVTMIGHTAWSIIDNLEWAEGYTAKFGLYRVNFSDPERTRTAKDSSKVYASIIKNRKLPEEYLDKET